jgi:ketosteroid isomerase-like protein
MADLESALAKLQASYASAVYKRDAEAFVRLYDPAVRVFDAWGLWEHVGTEPWRLAVEGWFSSHADEKIKVTFMDTQCHGTPSHAFVSATGRYAWIGADGKETRAMEHRITWGLRTTGHVLRILHEHTSMPVGFEDMKAILQRKAGA